MAGQANEQTLMTIEYQNPNDECRMAMRASGLFGGVAIAKGQERSENAILQNEPNLKSRQSPYFMRVKWWFWGQKNEPNKPNLKPNKAK